LILLRLEVAVSFTNSILKSSLLWLGKEANQKNAGGLIKEMPELVFNVPLHIFEFGFFL